MEGLITENRRKKPAISMNLYILTFFGSSTAEEEYTVSQLIMSLWIYSIVVDMKKYHSPQRRMNAINKMNGKSQYLLENFGR